MWYYFLSSDFMVPSKMCNICKQIPRTSFRVIENLQIFFTCFSVISFLSSDFTVPTTLCNMCKKHWWFPQQSFYISFFIWKFKVWLHVRRNFLKDFNYLLEIQSDPWNAPENIEKLAWEPWINLLWWRMKLK